MMIKYRVHEVAKDLNVPSKEIVDLLQKHFGEVKKHMTALNEAELDVIFEHYTQARQLESFDAYFARQAKEEPEQAEQPAVQEPLKQPVKQQAKPVAAQNPAKPAAQQGQPAQQQGQQPKRKAVLPGKITPVGPKPAAQQPPKKPAAPAPQPRPAAQPQRQGDPNSNTVVKPAGRIINTRSTNVNIDKYNEKYDRLASEKVKVENTVQKQKDRKSVV